MSLRDGLDIDISGEMSEPVEARALKAQSELLPYALGFFAVALPVFVWAAAYADDGVWLSLVFAQFSLNWAGFYFAVNRYGPKGARPASPRLRAWLHMAGSLAWALTVAEIAAFAAFAGPVGPVLMAMDVAAAVACLFFTSPWLLGLLVTFPLVATAPVLAQVLIGDVQGATSSACAVAFAMTLCMIMNRILRRQFALAHERERLMSERASSLDTAQKLAKSKSQILATLSHEIRNGLSGVTHVLSAAASGGRAAPSREQLSAALHAANELLEVLNATLDTETAAGGRLAVATRPFDAARLARSTVLLIRPKAAAKGLELVLHIDETVTSGSGSGAAVGDPVRVRQVLSNLVGNAIKYTARGRVEVRIQRAGDQRLRFEVADTGPGLSAEELERAFEPFARIDRVGLGISGAGLGLSLSRELARLMEGEVSAESAVGVGSRFWLELPFDAAATPSDAAEEMADFDAAPAQVVRSLRVLLAEDDALAAAMTRAILEQLGHQVVQAQGGQRALELAEFCPFDLAMLSGRLACMNGPEAPGYVHALSEAIHGAPIIALVGGESGEAEACLAAGADQALRKPANVTGVARAIASALETQDDEDQAQPRAAGQIN
jgi:signal transduction histidine kinase/ActR/RegA family two-component response regulator